MSKEDFEKLRPSEQAALYEMGFQTINETMKEMEVILPDHEIKDLALKRAHENSASATLVQLAVKEFNKKQQEALKSIIK